MTLQRDHPWVSQHLPVVVSAPMMKIALSKYALATSAAGGIGFLGAGYDLSGLEAELTKTSSLLQSGKYPNLTLHDGMLPIGVGVQNWGADLDLALAALKSHPVAAVWFFGPKKLEDYKPWADAIRQLNPKTKIWIQIGTVSEALKVAALVKPDVLVVQGSDAGGHGLAQRAGIITLLPEVDDALIKHGFNIPLVAAGGIMDHRGTAAALCLGAQGVCLGTRLLACKEAVIAPGYQNEILRAGDGGVNTVGSTVYDAVRGIKGWPSEYAGRSIINQSYLDAQRGMPSEENERLYKEEMEKGDQGWGPHGRMTTYAGTGIGLVTDVKSIQEIVKEVQDGALQILGRAHTGCTNGERTTVAAS